MINNDCFKRLNGLNCSEYLIKGVVNSFNRDFELMYLGAWGIDIDFQKDMLDEGFISQNTSDSWKYLKAFHGVQINSYRFEDYQEFCNLVREELSSNMPVLVSVDLYWVPWATQDYLQFNWGHEILIIGENLTGWRCYDFFSSEENVMPFDLMKCCFLHARTFQVLPIPRFTPEACVEELKQNIHRNLISTNAFEKIMHLGKRFIEFEQIQRDIRKWKDLTDFQKSPLLETINRIAQTRSQYALMLRFFSEKYSDYRHLATYAGIFDDLAATWKSVWGMLQKAYLIEKTEPIIIRIGNRLKEIAQLEENTCNALLNDLAPSLTYRRAWEQLPQQGLPLHLEGYMNHKSLGLTDNPGNAAFQSGFIVADKKLQLGYIVADNTIFKVSSVSDEYDDVTCIGQELSVNMQAVAISVLCCAEFAHQVEELVIIGENVELSIPFCVTAWTWSTAEFQQKIAWEGNEGFVTAQGVRVSPLPGHFFTKKYSFPERIAVKSIKLPYCPNIHIFGITVHG